MKFQIKDFVDLHAIEVEPMEHGGDKLVLITQTAAGMRFQHTMRTDQARYLAAALQMAADEADKMEPHVHMVGGEA